MSAGGHIFGQFRVGFLSAYLVRIRFVSTASTVKMNGTSGSSAGVSFTVQNDTEMVHEEDKRGTKLIFNFREDQSEFLEERRLTDLVKKLSEFIRFPIELHVEKSKEKEVTDSGENEDDNRGGRYGG